MSLRSIPHINVSDPNLRLILQSMKERIEGISTTSTGNKTTTTTSTPSSTTTITGLPVGGTDGQVLTKQSSNNGDAAWETPAESTSTSGTPEVETFTPTTNQTVFNLMHTPIALTTSVLVNQAILQYGLDFTVGGTTVTLLPAVGYHLATTDSVQITYNY